MRPRRDDRGAAAPEPEPDGTLADAEVDVAYTVLSVVDAASGSSAELILKHCIASLAEVLSFTSVANMARVHRICRLAATLGEMCGVRSPDHLARLAFTSQLGTLTLPEGIILKMHRGQLLTENERRQLRATPNLGDHLLARIPGLELDREIVRLHDVHSVPLSGLPMESAVLRVALAYDRLQAGDTAPSMAVAILRGRDPMYSARVLDVLEQYTLRSNPADVERVVLVSELAPHMILTHDIVSRDGVLRLGAGHELTPVIIEHLRIFEAQHMIDDTVVITGPLAPRGSS